MPPISLVQTRESPCRLPVQEQGLEYGGTGLCWPHLLQALYSLILPSTDPKCPLSTALPPSSLNLHAAWCQRTCAGQLADHCISLGWHCWLLSRPICYTGRPVPAAWVHRIAVSKTYNSSDNPNQAYRNLINIGTQYSLLFFFLLAWNY